MPAHPPPDWRQAAEALGRRLPKECLHPVVLAWADASSARAKWGVGFSGGADSLALLLLLWAHWPARRRHLRGLHFNHRLRGRESRADEIFCRRVCAALGVEFVAGAWPGRRRQVSEAAAREARLAFLERHARVVWLGHQMDDIAETFFMRLARGSGAGGLSAPRPLQSLPRRRLHLRPLLTLPRAEIVAALRATCIPWREDSSNESGDFFRNRIRRRVLPAWKTAAQRDALRGAARSRLLLDEDESAFAAWLAALQPLAPNGELMLERLAGKPRALLRRALHDWLLAQPAAGRLSRQGFDALLESVERSRPVRHSLGREGFAVIRGGRLRFERTTSRRRNFPPGAN